MTKPVTIRGVAYPSQKAAAEALGVAKATVCAAAKRGTLDKVGLGLSQPGCEPAYTRPTTVAGVTYPSRKAAAEALGVTLSQLSGYMSVVEVLEAEAAADVIRTA